MKRVILLLIACISVAHLYGQPETVKKNTIGVHIVPGYGLRGGGSWGGNFGVGVDYTRRFSKHWSFRGGLERFGFSGKAGKTEDGRDKRVLKWEATSLPAEIKYKFDSPVFINFGPVVDIWHYSYGAEVGLGLRLGIGLEHEFRNGLTVYLNPSVNYSGWNDVETRHFRLLGNMGIGYKF